ncbi:MAG: hypothetical protein LBQ14_12420, partial [Treponema sp.]|nr:hypothetical protein [Treponema sp.]
KKYIWNIYFSRANHGVLGCTIKKLANGSNDKIFNPCRYYIYKRSCVLNGHTKNTIIKINI